ncbi:MAG: FHA domain-containing protein [Acidobacteriota bacterium]
MPGPNPGSKPLYQLRYMERGQPRVFEFGAQEVLIGRAPDNSLTIGGDFGISRNHAKLIATEDKCMLVDLGSTNGTSVNGVPVTKTQLSDGDEVTLGKFSLRFHDARREQVILSEEKEFSSDSGTIIRSVQDLRKYVEASSLRPDVRGSRRRPPTSASGRSRRATRSSSSSRRWPRRSSRCSRSRTSSRW